MELSEAQDTFHTLLKNISDDDKAKFLIWIRHVWFAADCSGEGPAIAHRKLRDIAEDIKKSGVLPINSIFPSEHLCQPTSKQNTDCNSENTVHVDAFLYDEVDVEELVEQGKLNRNYCQDCNSRNTVPLNFVTHSASIARIEFIFRSILPYQQGTKIVDVGSRLGAMLYGAYVYTKASQIIGVEINADFCALQKKIILMHGMNDRITVVHDDISNVPEIISDADVVILNNVFEFFLPAEQQRKSWEFLKCHLTKKGTILVTIPSLESIWEDLQIQSELKIWVKKRPITDPLIALTAEHQVELAEICSYEVL